MSYHTTKKKIISYSKSILLQVGPFLLSLLRVLTSLFITLSIFAFGFFIGSMNCEGKTVYYGTEAERVTLVYGGPTIIRFDEEVQTISQASKFHIHPADTKNPNYAVLSITPRFTRGESKVSFILANGTVVNTHMVILSKSTPEKTNSFYDFTPKKHLIASSKKVKGSQISDLELMKAMIRWDTVIGYKAQHLSRTINTGIKGVSAKLVRLYTGPKYNGYVFKIKNNSKKVYNIDLRKLNLGKPNVAILSQLDQKVLQAQKNNTTFLRVVAKPTSVYYNLSLPIAPAANPEEV